MFTRSLTHTRTHNQNSNIFCKIIVGAMIDVVLISTGWLLPADGSHYVMRVDASKLDHLEHTADAHVEWPLFNDNDEL
jgi:hypothetical protein